MQKIFHIILQKGLSGGTSSNTMNCIDLIFSCSNDNIRVESVCWTQQIFKTVDFYLKIHNVRLMGLEESGMVHRLWVDNAKN